MPLPLAHGSWIELIAWLAWQAAFVAAWLVVIAVLSLIVGLVIGSVLLMIVRRGRYLLVVVPLLTIAALMLINPTPRVARWTGQPVFDMGVVSIAGWIVGGLCGLIAAASLATTGRIVRRVGEGPGSENVPAPAAHHHLG